MKLQFQQKLSQKNAPGAVWVFHNLAHSFQFPNEHKMTCWLLVLCSA